MVTEDSEIYIQSQPNTDRTQVSKYTLSLTLPIRSSLLIRRQISQKSAQLVLMRFVTDFGPDRDIIHTYRRIFYSIHFRRFLCPPDRQHRIEG